MIRSLLFKLHHYFEGICEELSEEEVEPQASDVLLGLDILWCKTLVALVRNTINKTEGQTMACVSLCNSSSVFDSTDPIVPRPIRFAKVNIYKLKNTLLIAAC